jgi:cellulose synthase operon protein C
MGFALVLLCGFAGAARGFAATTPESCASLKLHGKRAEAEACYGTLTKSNSAYLRAEGFWGLGDYDNANQQFRDATAGPDSPALAKVR